MPSAARSAGLAQRAASQPQVRPPRRGRAPPGPLGRTRPGLTVGARGQPLVVEKARRGARGPRLARVVRIPAQDLATGRWGAGGAPRENATHKAWVRVGARLAPRATGHTRSPGLVSCRSPPSPSEPGGQAWCLRNASVLRWRPRRGLERAPPPRTVPAKAERLGPLPTNFGCAPRGSARRPRQARQSLLTRSPGAGRGTSGDAGRRPTHVAAARLPCTRVGAPPAPRAPAARGAVAPGSHARHLGGVFPRSRLDFPFFTF